MNSSHFYDFLADAIIETATALAVNDVTGGQEEQVEHGPASLQHHKSSESNLSSPVGPLSQDTAETTAVLVLLSFVQQIPNWV